MVMMPYGKYYMCCSPCLYANVMKYTKVDKYGCYT